MELKRIQLYYNRFKKDEQVEKLFTVFVLVMMMVRVCFAAELSYGVDPVATAQAPWKVGEKIITEGRCGEDKYYREFIGITLSDLVLVQDFYFSGEKLTNPFLMTLVNAKKTMKGLSCMEGIEGRYTMFYKSGYKKVFGDFRDGMAKGLITTWYEAGQKRSEANYKRGELDGRMTVWYRNGQVNSEMSFMNNKLEGVLTQWYENGQKKSDANYKKGELDGRMTIWYENGSKQYVVNYKNNEREGLMTNWHENGQKKGEVKFKNGKMIGIGRGWDEKGRLIEEKDFDAP